MRVVEGRNFDIDLSSFKRQFEGEKQPPVAIFDFDGVLCGPEEDLAYKLPESAGERSALGLIARRNAIDPSLYDTPYLRHLVLQVTLRERGIIPTPGPALGLAQELAAARLPFFILTARSGAAAIDRVLLFVREHGLTPQEVFFVGRVAKGRQLALLRNTIPTSRKIIYFEDSVRHARNSHAQDMPAFKAIHISWDSTEAAAAEALVKRMLPSVRTDTDALQEM